MSCSFKMWRNLLRERSKYRPKADHNYEICHTPRCSFAPCVDSEMYQVSETLVMNPAELLDVPLVPAELWRSHISHIHHWQRAPPENRQPRRHRLASEPRQKVLLHAKRYSTLLQQADEKWKIISSSHAQLNYRQDSDQSLSHTSSIDSNWSSSFFWPIAGP